MYAPPFQARKAEQSTTRECSSPLDFKPDSFDENYTGGSTPVEKTFRIGFVRKVFTIISVQLLVTASIAYLLASSDWFFDLSRQFQFILYLAGLIAIVIPLMISWSTTLSRRVPLNYILLGIFTVAESYCVGFMANHYKKESVLLAVYLTAIVVGTLSCYALKSKREITYSEGLLITLILGAIISVCLSWLMKIRLVDSLIFAGGCILSGMYFIYDVKKLMVGKDKISLDDYIRGAMHLYIDIMRIFINTLQILSRRGYEEGVMKRKRL